MCSSTTTVPFRTTTAHLIRRRNLSLFAAPTLFLRSKNQNLLRLSASVADTHIAFSWSSPSSATAAADDFNGWAVVEAPPSIKKERGLPTFVIGSVAAIIAAVSYFSLYKKGFKLQFRSLLPVLHEIITPVESKSESPSIVQTDASAGTRVEMESSIPDATKETLTLEKPQYVKVSVEVDSTQLEALSNLKKLKIIEDDVRADELCTRREYVRWLVKLNSLLERNPRHRIVPSISLSGSIVTAFNDVGVEDPDFEFIQALAEAGIVPSKLSRTNSSSDNLKEDGSFCFYPQRFISRQDLISWKAQFEYEFSPGITEQMSRMIVGYMDMKEIGSTASPELFIDMLSGDDSIIRKVFGQTRRFQPNKPVTKAQAAVALTSGRMTEAVDNEILRLEAENSLRQAAMEEIRSELLDKGDIERFWDEKMNEERSRGFEVEKLHIAHLHDMEQEKIVQARTFAELLKEKAAMDCQRQLLLSLKEEVDEMLERLASERAMYVAEQCNVQKLLGELQTKQEGMLDTKSILEAETEALRILRSWVEDEARKSQARAKVLEEVGRRWKWDNQA